MQNTDPTPLVFYEPKYYNLLSPTFHAWVKLTATDVHALKEWPQHCPGQDVYFYQNHPIRFICLVGVIVDFEVYDKRFVMILDDSSGATIEITCGRRPSELKDDNRPSGTGPAKQNDQGVIGQTKAGYTVDLSGVDVGSVVKVKGGVGSFRGEKQMTLERLTFVHTTNEEAQAWVNNAAYRRNILSKPWVVSADDLKEYERAVRRENRRQKAIEQARERHLARQQKGQVARLEKKARYDGEERRVKVAHEHRAKQERRHRIASAGIRDKRKTSQA